MSDKELIAAAKAASACISTAESCTGGLIARRLTAIAGSSEVYWGGWVTYDNSAKETQLGVPRELLNHYGAVAPETAFAMAEGGLAAMSQSIEMAEASSVGAARLRICVSSTGVAGPGGGTDDRPVGLCFVGIAATGLPTAVIEIRAPLGQSRELNQTCFADAVFQALAKLVRHISSN